MARDEQLSDRGQRVEERTDAEHDQQDLDDLPGRGVGLRKPADGRGDVERPAERVPVPDPLAERQAERAEQQQGERDRPQQGDAPGVDHQLVARRGRRGCGAAGRGGSHEGSGDVKE